MAACATDQTPRGPAATYVVPDVPTRAYSAISSEPPDRCGAESMAWLVGRPKTEVPVPVEMSNRRVQCTACDRGAAVVPQRLNIYFNPDTGLVEQVACG